MTNIQEYLHIIIVLLVIAIAGIFYIGWKYKDNVTGFVTRRFSRKPSSTGNEDKTGAASSGGRRRRKHK